MGDISGFQLIAAGLARPTAVHGRLDNPRLSAMVAGVDLDLT